MRAHSEGEWADLIRRDVQGYTADDASLALVALGYRDFAGLRNAFAQRHSVIFEICGRGRPEGAAEAATIRAWQDSTWHDYRTDYEAYLPAPQEEHA
jgi:hypothetical protein